MLGIQENGRCRLWSCHCAPWRARSLRQAVHLYRAGVRLRGHRGQGRGRGCAAQSHRDRPLAPGDRRRHPRCRVGRPRRRAARRLGVWAWRKLHLTEVDRVRPHRRRRLLSMSVPANTTGRLCMSTIWLISTPVPWNEHPPEASSMQRPLPPSGGEGLRRRSDAPPASAIGSPLGRSRMRRASSAPTVRGSARTSGCRRTEPLRCWAGIRMRVRSSTTWSGDRIVRQSTGEVPHV